MIIILNNVSTDDDIEEEIIQNDEFTDKILRLRR